MIIKIGPDACDYRVHHALLTHHSEYFRKALRGDDMGEIRSAQEELTRVFSEAGQTFYQQQGAQAGDAAGAEQPASGATDGAAKPDDVVEADYEIVDDEKKN